MAYQSDESGRNEIYVRSFPGAGGKWQISTQGGTEPLWARNGRELFDRNGTKMMSVDITPGQTWQPDDCNVRRSGTRQKPFLGEGPKRLEATFENSLRVVVAEPLFDRGCIDPPEVGGHLQVTIVEVGEARMLVAAAVND